MWKIFLKGFLTYVAIDTANLTQFIHHEAIYIVGKNKPYIRAGNHKY